MFVTPATNRVYFWGFSNTDDTSINATKKFSELGHYRYNSTYHIRSKQVYTFEYQTWWPCGWTLLQITSLRPQREAMPEASSLTYR